MRIMEIRPFKTQLEINDPGSLIETRLRAGLITSPDQAVPLVGYMAWPNDDAARNGWGEAYDRDDELAMRPLLAKLKTIQQHWALTADIVHLVYDLQSGQHQRKRGGASLSKSIALGSAIGKSKGTQPANFWRVLKKYKDVAHLVTAAMLVSWDAQTRHRQKPYGLALHQFQPYRIGLLLPELVLSVALTIQEFGLEHVSHGHRVPMLDPDTVWRIPAAMNVSPLPLPQRKIRTEDIKILNVRRSGNRGRANRRKTTPIFP